MSEIDNDTVENVTAPPAADKPKYKVASKWKNSTPLRIVGVVALGVVGVAVWSATRPVKRDVAVASIDVPVAPNIGSVAGADKSTPIYDAAIKEDDAARVAAAKKKNESVAPTLSSADKVDERGSRRGEIGGQIAPSPTVTSQNNQPQVAQPQQPAPDNSAAVAGLMAEQLGKLIADWKRPLGGSGSVVAASSAAPPAAGAAPTTPATPVARTRRITAGTRLVARLNDEVVSTRLGYPVTATVIGGDFAGATLLSSTQRATPDRLGIGFDLMIVPNATRSTPIAAEAVDVDGKGGGVASDVDRHIVANVVGTALTVGFGAYAQGLNRTQQTAVSNGVGGSVVADSGFDKQRARDYAIAQSGAAVTAPIAAAGQKPPTVTAASGMIIGVTFRADAEVPFFDR
jgi:hypothetical protein